MGLFSFLKNTGPKIFGGKKEEAAPAAASISNEERTERSNNLRAIALRSLIDSFKLPVENLDIVVNDDTVIVYGQTASQADKERVILTIGNVDGIATVDDRLSVSAPAPEPPARFYEVKKGDNLSKIAKEMYGSANKYPVIFEANKPMLKDANLIYPGQMLRIPELT